MSKPKAILGGVAAVADMLNHMEPADRQRLLSDVAKRDPALANQIEEQLFTFEHLAQLDAPTLQLLLGKVQHSVLAISLRTASEEVKSAVFRNLSVRTADSLREEMTSSAPRQISEVTAAQATITAIAKTIMKR